MHRHGKPPRKQLDDALFFSKTVQQIIIGLCASEAFMPDEYDFDMLRTMAEICDHTRFLALHAEIRLHQRLKGEPESPLPQGCDGKP